MLSKSNSLKEILICDVKVAKKAMIQPGQRRMDHTFHLEFQVQAISVDSLLCILDTVVFTTIAASTDDNDDNLSHHLNGLVKGVIERETRALAASMTMAEILRFADSFVSHEPVPAFGNVQLQLELKHLGRFILCDAYIYVKPQLVSSCVSLLEMSVAEEEEREPIKVFLDVVQADQLREAAAFPSQGEQGVEISAEDGGKQEVESTDRASKTDEIMAGQSPMPLIPQVIYSNDNTAGHLERQKTSWPNYALNTLIFACTMLFSAYMNLSSSTSITIKILLVVDIVVFFILDGVLYINLPSWGNALVCTSWFLLELAMCLVILPFNGYYALAILAVLFLIAAVALLQPKFQHSVQKHVLPSFTTGDSEDHYLNHLFDISNGIATCGGVVTGILGYYSYMVGPVTAAGFFFFSTVLLGLYVMMVIAMRAVSPSHAACLAIVLKALLLLTVITASVSFVRHSVTM